ncbi:MAG: asparagine synthase (glutamine-hydrolyzing) [Rhodospirillales bacterium]|nr:asparagine synthase (glutamine-hydrolyzing) [Rhodospirillales bacterium]
MCGIVGLFTAKGGFPRSAGLGDALRVMAHRGPDGISYYDAPDGCFKAGFCRLSIIDLETGQQPLQDDAGGRVLLGNGEIYNYLELRKALPNHAYKTKGDMETVLAAATEYGDDFIHHLNGMFALALYDLNKRRLTLVRDRLGIKPLYWAELPGGGVVFASEIKAIFATGLIKPEINEAAIGAYLSHGYVASPDTMFAGIKKLPPAHRLTVDSGGIGIERYWLPSADTELPGGPDEIAEYMLELLSSSVQMQLRSDVPVGALLSGGIDSGLMVALAARHSSRPINTFTVSFEGALVDEAPLARKVADRYATKHTEIVISADDIAGHLVNLAWFAEEPLNDAALLPNYLIERALSEHITVALNGTGGDELFAGYGRYFQLPVERSYLTAPGWLRRNFIEPAAGMVSPMTAWRLKRAAMFDSDRGAYLHAHSTLFPPPIMALIGSTVDLPGPAQTGAFNLYMELTGASKQTAALYADQATYLPEDLLTLLDRTSMAVSVEGRVPFLDHRLVEAALSVPDAIRTPGNRQKALERAMAQDLLPGDVLSAPKRGFASPVPHWIKSGLGDTARRLLTRPETLERGWWSAEGIGRLLQSPDQHGFRVYSLLMLELAVRIFTEQPLASAAPDVALNEFS